MRVRKAINNNVVSCEDENGRELVVMGRGLGFRVKTGDTIDPSGVEKIFRMDTPEQTHRLEELFTQLPAELLELCNRIIETAKDALGRRLNESIYLTLTDHIQFALNRVKQGMDFPNPLVSEVRMFYPTEYGLGRYALEEIRKGMGVALPEDEAASIALHLVNAEYDTSMNATMRSAQVLQPMIRILENWPGLTRKADPLDSDELIIQIKLMAMQAFSQVRQDWAGQELVELVKDKFPEAFSCAGAMVRCLEEYCGHAIPAADQAFLAICIQKTYLL